MDSGYPMGNPGFASLIAQGTMSALVLVLLALSSTPASAQSAKNFDTKTITPKAAQPKTSVANNAKAAVTAAKAPGSVSIPPSRYVGEADLEAQVQSLSSSFSMKTRVADPFGQLQDPDAKPVIKATTAKAPRRVAPVLATPFADIIRLIDVKMIMSKEKSFLVGNRSIKEGDRIPLTFRGKNIRVEVSSVTSRQIEFRNLESGETAFLKINLLPNGMTPGTRSISAPGMVPDRPDSPLNLDSGDTSNTTSQNP